MQEGIQSQAYLLYKVSFIIGAASFTLATSSSLFISDPSEAFSIFALLTRVFACFKAFAELLELIAAPLPMWRTPLCLLSFIGYLVYLVGADENAQFNTGEWYLAAVLITSVATELKILSIVLENRNFKKIISKEKHRLVQYTAVAIGSVFFLVGTLVLSLSEDNEKLQSLKAAGVINFIGGIFYSVSIYSFFMKEKYQGYKQFQTAMDIPSIGEY